MDKENYDAFKKEYLAIWVTNPLYDKAYDLWCEYYYETEKYDRSICSHINKYGIFIPTTHEENRLVQYNSRKWWGYINKIRLQNKIDDKTWQDAKMNAIRLSYIGLEEWNERRNIICQLQDHK